MMTKLVVQWLMMIIIMVLQNENNVHHKWTMMMIILGLGRENAEKDGYAVACLLHMIHRLLHKELHKLIIEFLPTL